MPVPIRCVLMRGGTSKAVFVREADLPRDEALRERVILSMFGSPDPRQIDGLGGADPLTSKLALIGPPRPDAENPSGTALTYTFGQVDIRHPLVDWDSLCGNITSAVGAYAVYEGLAPAGETLARVYIHNTNLGRRLTVEVPVEAGRPVEEGDYVVPGVPGSGARILVDFADTAGAATGALLPTGNPVDRLEVPGVGVLDASLVDIGNAHVFLRAGDLGLKGTESPAELVRDAQLMGRLEEIRRAAARRMNMSSAGGAVSPATPILGIVSAPADYAMRGYEGTVRAGDVDVVSRLMFMQQPHLTHAGTSTVCTGTASRVEGTLVHEAARRSNGNVLRIGHPAGVIETETEVTRDSGTYRVTRATLGRTARRLMEGYVFVPDRVFSDRGA